MALGKSEKVILIGLLLGLFILVGLRYYLAKSQEVELRVIRGEEQVVQQ